MSIHFLICDKLGNAIANGVRAVCCQLPLGTAGKIDQPQIASTDEADIATLGRDLRIGGETATVSQLADRRGLHVRDFSNREVVQIQLAAQRKQQAFAVGCPVVVDDASQRSNPLPLAAGFFFVGQDFDAGQYDFRIDQQAGLTGVDVVLPEIQLIAVVILAAQERHSRTIGCDLGLNQGWTRQGCVAGDGFQGEHMCVLRRLSGKGHGQDGEHDGKRATSEHYGVTSRIGSDKTSTIG